MMDKLVIPDQIHEATNSALPSQPSQAIGRAGSVPPVPVPPKSICP